MKELLEYLPLLNLLTIAPFMAFLRHEIRIKVLEIHKRRVEIELGFDDRRAAHD